MDLWKSFTHRSAWQDSVSNQRAREQALSIQNQFDFVKKYSPRATVTSILPAPEPKATTEFVVAEAGVNKRIFVDPMTGRILGERPVLDFMELMIRIHKTLLLGDVGRTLVELGVSWGVILASPDFISGGRGVGPKDFFGQR